ncbi:hypothetical protein PR202_ga27648 [Eleusine coracana subsp. coracana]|uniref:Xyloglucan endotransglucosylase/hydrolase n=1 Tax=Eleusine coracana subsp. coracana TaxID=191504 RepID=A0AAV5DI66_ELECO|nr:hypothetical protein QOZ80_8AG0622640 [Eleusine coracana subsp. coracana]GJN09625.1 hypothetical protein PR202_ga27648 [Eleusine coracana subsp. coracana]
MARRSSDLLASLAVAVLVALLGTASAQQQWFDEKTFTTEGNIRVDNDGSGQVASLLLDRQSGAGFFSKQKYLYGEFSIQMKLIPGNSAGTVTSFYLTSGPGNGTNHDEIDMEFMGNSTGDPVVLNTNVWVSGDGKKEHQFNLWFDPAADFHTYTIIWNPKNIIFKVDDLFIRSFKRYSDLPYPTARPMEVHATLWDGSWWATRKGEVPIDWSHGPFVVSYRRFNADACAPMGEGKPPSCAAGSERWMDRVPSAAEMETVAWAKKSYMSYNYCEDGWRFPQGFPGECGRN